MQKYCPNNSNFTFREICCAPPKDNCKDDKKEKNCNCNDAFHDQFNCSFPPPNCFKPDCNCPCGKNDDKEHCKIPHCPKPICPPCEECKHNHNCNSCICIDHRFLLWTALYPYLFK